MKRMKKPALIALSCLMILSSLVLPFNAREVKAAEYNYDPATAVAYAKAHANEAPENASGDCANFVSNCLIAGGMGITKNSGTGPLLREIGRVTGLEWHGLDLQVNSSGYVTKDLNPGILSEGDVVFNWCENCPNYSNQYGGICPHVVICTGFDAQGRAKYCSHTSAKNDVAVNYCYNHECGHKLKMKVLHFDSAVGTEMTSGYERTLPDGDYIIANTGRMDGKQFWYLDIEGDGNEVSGRNVHVWNADADVIPDCDVWSITYVNGFYRIHQKGTNLDLDVEGASRKAGTNVIAWENNNQLWAISPNAAKTGYRIQSKLSGFSLNVQGNVELNSNVGIATGNDLQQQSWVFIPYKPSQPIAEGRYILLSTLADGWTLDVAGNSGDIPNGTNVQLWTDAEGISQWNSFDFKKLDNGYYTITHAASGKALDVEGCWTNYNTNILLWDSLGVLNQQWAIRQTDTGYALIARHSGMALDDKEWKLEDGNNIEQYPYNGKAVQSWKFVKAEYTVKYDANGGTGAPASQTKYYNTGLVLSSVKPSMANCSFLGWSTSKTATTATYSAGKTFKVDKDTTLYAVWKSDSNLITDKTLEINKSFQYQVPGVAASNIKWSIGNSAVATVSSNGTVTGKSIGNTYLYVGLPDGQTIKCLIRVVNPTLKINYTEKTLHINQTFQFTASNTSGQKITWSVGNTSVATVDANGKVTAKSAANTYLYAKSADGRTAKCLLKVVNPGTLGINYTEKTVYLGQSFTFTAKNAGILQPTWSIGNTSIAVVYSNGMVTAKSVGNTYLTVKTDDGRSAKCLVKVVDPGPLSITYTEKTIKVGATFQFNAKNPAGQTVSWRVGNSSVASVDSSGKVTGKSVANTYLYATTPDGREVRCLLKIVA